MDGEACEGIAGIGHDGFAVSQRARDLHSAAPKNEERADALSDKRDNGGESNGATRGKSESVASRVDQQEEGMREVSSEDRKAKTQDGEKIESKIDRERRR